jgi:chromosome segregation ATPase
MGARESLQRLADRKSQEIAELERQIDMAKAYLQAIQDSIKALPRDIVAHNGT